MRGENVLVRAVGWRATILHGDPTVADRFRWMRRHLRPGRLRTLDAGCGTGAFTMYAAKLGNEAVGISFNARDIAVARERARILGVEGVRFVDADLRRLGGIAHELGTFDQVLLLETIEHVLDDRGLVADVGALVKPGGRLILSTPSKHHRPMWGEKLSEVEDGGHVRWGYTHDEVRKILDGCGFDVDVEEEFGGVLAQKLANVMWRVGRFNLYLSWVLTLPLRALQALDGPITRALRWPPLSIGVVARKRA